jgi:hypothetical protein
LTDATYREDVTTENEELMRGVAFEDEKAELTEFTGDDIGKELIDDGTVARFAKLEPGARLESSSSVNTN